MATFPRCSSALLVASTILWPIVAVAGPCTDDIASVGKQLSQSAALGPVTTGTLSGSTSGAKNANASTVAGADAHGTSADQRVGGTAGTKEMDAASSKVATSDVDVRQQQVGHPTAAGQAMSNDRSSSTETKPALNVSGPSPDDRASRAKVAWQKAVDLNAKDDASCKGAINQAKQDLQGS